MRILAGERPHGPHHCITDRLGAWFCDWTGLSVLLSWHGTFLDAGCFGGNWEESFNSLHKNTGQAKIGMRVEDLTQHPEDAIVWLVQQQA